MGQGGIDKIVKTGIAKGGEPKFEEDFLFSSLSQTHAIFVKLWNENERYEDEKVNPIGSFVVTKKQLCQILESGGTAEAGGAASGGADKGPEGREDGEKRGGQEGGGGGEGEDGGSSG